MQGIREIVSRSTNYGMNKLASVRESVLSEEILTYLAHAQLLSFLQARLFIYVLLLHGQQREKPLDGFARLWVSSESYKTCLKCFFFPIKVYLQKGRNSTDV